VGWELTSYSEGFFADFLKIAKIKEGLVLDVPGEFYQIMEPLYFSTFPEDKPNIEPQQPAAFSLTIEHNPPS
jgi:hypothetical protein